MLVGIWVFGFGSAIAWKKQASTSTGAWTEVELEFVCKCPVWGKIGMGVWAGEDDGEMLQTGKEHFKEMSWGMTYLVHKRLQLASGL